MSLVHKNGFALLETLVALLIAMLLFFGYLLYMNDQVTPELSDTNSPSSHSPQLSKLISFVRNDQIWLLDINLNSEIQITHFANSYSTKNHGWSPDGQYILYQEGLGGILYSYNTTSNEQHLLYQHTNPRAGGGIFPVDFTDEGIWFVESVFVDGNAEVKLFSINYDGTNLTQEMPTQTVKNGYCSLKLNDDHTKLYYSIAGEAFCEGIHFFNTATGISTQLFLDNDSSPGFRILSNNRVIDLFIGDEIRLYSISDPNQPKQLFSTPYFKESLVGFITNQDQSVAYIGFRDDDSSVLKQLDLTTGAYLDTIYPTVNNGNYFTFSPSADDQTMAVYIPELKSLQVLKTDTSEQLLHNLNTYNNIYMQGVNINQMGAQ